MALTDLLTKFKSVTAASGFLNALDGLISTFEEYYTKDGDAKDALIDEVTTYLQSLKGTKNG